MTDIIPEHRRLPFDAEKAKRGEAVCLALGNIREVGYDPRRKDFPFYNLGEAYEECWTEKGRFHNTGAQSPKDLRMVAPDEPEAKSEEPATIPAAVDPGTLVPFDEARARKGDQVYTDNGQPASILQYKMRGTAGLAVVVRGKFGDFCGSFHPSNLRMLPKAKQQVWVALYDDLGTQWWSLVGGPCNTRERAIQFARNKGLKHIARCEIEEIEG